MKKALITGQYGAYLVAFLRKKMILNSWYKTSGVIIQYRSYRSFAACFHPLQHIAVQHRFR
jgi:hypothetical protein